MPLGDEYPHGLEPVDGVKESEGYEEAVDRAAAEEAYREEVERREEMEAIRDSYHAWMKDCQIAMGAGRDEERTYVAAVEAVRGKGFDPDPAAIREYCERYAVASWDGFFMSALLNESSHDGFTLPGMDDISYLGYRNKKDITVDGDIKNAAGMRMQGGTLTIRGDAGRDVGMWMEGGTIELHGTADIAPDLEERGRVETVNGGRRYTLEDEEVLGRVRDALGGG